MKKSIQKKGWMAILIGLLFTGLVLVGCSQTVGSNTTGAGEKIDPPLAVTNLKASYSASKKTVTVSWDVPGGTTAQKHKVTLGSATKEVFMDSTSFSKIEADNKEHTLTVVGIAKDGTLGKETTTTFTATAALQVADITPQYTILAPQAYYSIEVSFINSEKIEKNTPSVKIFKGEQQDGNSSFLTKNSYSEVYTTFLRAPSTVGEYTIKVFNGEKEVEGKTATITVEEPRVETITLNRTEILPNFTITGTIQGNEALATANLSYKVTLNNEEESNGSISSQEFSIQAPSTEGSYTVSILWNSTELKSTTFTVTNSAEAPDLSNPFENGKKYKGEDSSSPSWEIQDNYLIEEEPKKSAWYTFSHDSSKKRITLTPYKLFYSEANKPLTREEYTEAQRSSPMYSQDATKETFKEQLENGGKEFYITMITGMSEYSKEELQNKSDEELTDIYINVQLKNGGYSSWDEWVDGAIESEMKKFDTTITYNYTADQNTGSLKVTEWWEEDTTFKTLYDRDADINFSYSDGNSFWLELNTQEFRIGGTSGSTYYNIQSLTDTEITLKASNSTETTTITYGSISDYGENQKKMDVTYNSTPYSLTYRLKTLSFTIQ